MKKIIELVTLAILLAFLSGLLFHFDAGKEITELVKTLVQKLAPWINMNAYA